MLSGCCTCIYSNGVVLGHVREVGDDVEIWDDGVGTVFESIGTIGGHVYTMVICINDTVSVFL